MTETVENVEIYKLPFYVLRDGRSRVFRVDRVTPERLYGQVIAAIDLDGRVQKPGFAMYFGPYLAKDLASAIFTDEGEALVALELIADAKARFDRLAAEGAREYDLIVSEILGDRVLDRKGAREL